MNNDLRQRAAESVANLTYREMQKILKQSRENGRKPSVRLNACRGILQQDLIRMVWLGFININNKDS